MLLPVAKYDPLFEHLCRADDGPLEMTFDEISRLVGGLPPTAYVRPAWWSNDPDTGAHIQAAAWRNAGRRIQHLDLRAELVRFSAAQWDRGA